MKVDYQHIAKDKLKEIGYEENFTILEKISKRSTDIALGVDSTELREQGAVDQGIIFGYACNETKELMPLLIMLTNQIFKEMDMLKKDKYAHIFDPDGKCQVSVVYEKGKPKKVQIVVVSTQTKSLIKRELYEDIIINEVLTKFLDDKAIQEADILINLTGEFVIGGPYADSGLTGRKIIVDTYGGGAFSGKDVRKVDRSAAYYARYVAKAIVEANLADRCEVCVAYSIGVADPVSLSINTFETGKLSDVELLEVVKKLFDFTPSNIRKELEFEKVKFKSLAAYGHIGREDLPVRWENVEDKAQELRVEYEKAKGTA